MRITAMILTIALVAAGALGCTATVPAGASSAPTQAVSSSAPATASPAPSSAAPVTESPVPSSAATTQPAESSPKDYNQIGSDLMAAESLGAVKMAMTQSALIAAIGQPDSKSKPELWGADGLNHSTWTYKSKGLSIGMAGDPKSKAELTVVSIGADAPCGLATAKGIKIGDKSDAVLAAYGFAVEDQTANGTKESITAGTEFNGVIFGMKDGLVSSIFIGASAE